MEIDISDADLAFEEEVLRNPYKLKGWLNYLDHKKPTPQALTIIYERALKALPGSYKLWRNYLLHRTNLMKGKNPFYFQRDFDKTLVCFERALLLLHKMPQIWLMYIRFIKRQPDVTKVRRVCDRALRSLAVTQHEQVWRVYVRFAEQVGGEMARRVYERVIKVWPNRAKDFIEFCEQQAEWGWAARQLVQELDSPLRNPDEEQQQWMRLANILQRHAGELSEEPWDVEQVIRDGIRRFAGEKQAGTLWTALAQWHIARGEMAQAQSVFEEAITQVRMVRDFAVVFDAYGEFLESVVTMEMERDVKEAAASGTLGNNIRTELRLVQLERLMDRRALLANDVELRQNSNSVQAWLKRVELWKQRSLDEGRSDKARRSACEMIKATFEEAVATVDAHKATQGTVSDLWLAFAQEFSEVKEKRQILDRAVEAPVGSVRELEEIYKAYVETELRARNVDGALRVLAQATRPPSSLSTSVAQAASRVNFNDEKVAASKRIFKSQRLWSLLVDLNELQGAVAGVRSAYERMIELRIATPQTIVNYAAFLEEQGFFEDSFRAYERGIAAFGYPVAVEIWNVYLRKFMDRYGGSRIERARDLFEQALDKCPPKYARPIYVAYGMLEEMYGRTRRALSVYERATSGVGPKERLLMFRFYAAKTALLVGLAQTRAVYERGVEELGDKEALQLALEFAQVERQLGEIDRARALFAYAAQLADPQVSPQLWDRWHSFEVVHGNEDTFKEMLRIKRSVQAKFSTDAQLLAAASASASAPAPAPAANSGKTEMESEQVASSNNPDELAIDDDDL
ncbi:pre-mRNA-splicing factor syf1 [Coemansia brasiliensis]|uniref:Pre-mRNA-splicing factor syf1 n=1 Tax=Coemansia brasiliensis TaxID=2650707 RepID=A0A9W8IDS6_9FUNG|nr:pre-mRNA-splicing factor syf1 [Coemansia brasiliensis]